MSVDLARENQAIQLLEGVAGANSAPLAGSKHGGKVKFKVPLRGCKVAYDPTSTIVGNTPPEFALMAIALGSGVANAPFTSAYVAAACDTGATYTSVPTTAGTFVPGQFFVSDSDGLGGNLATGWVKSKSGTPATLVLHDATMYRPASGDNIYPTATACLTTTQPSPLTIRYVGTSGLGYVLVGCVCESATISAGARQVPVLELSYTFTSHTRDATIGGMQVPVGYERVAPSISSKGSRLLVAGAVKDGVADLKIDYKATLAFVDSHNALQGVSECVVTSKTVKITCSIPIDSLDTLTNGSSPYETSLETGATIGGICLTTGTMPGKICSIFAPAVRVSAQPKLTDKGGFLCEQLEFEAAAYTSDGTSTTTVDASPADTVFRVALA